MDEFIPGFEDPDDELSGYYDDDGNKLDPDLISKPGLCLLCANDENPYELVLCNLNRLDQAGEEGEFRCEAYKPKNDQTHKDPNA
jgi:hypothetical protein